MASLMPLILEWIDYYLKVFLALLTQDLHIIREILNDSPFRGDTRHRRTRDMWVKNIFYLTRTASLHFNYIHPLVSRHE